MTSRQMTAQTRPSKTKVAARWMVFPLLLTISLAGLTTSALAKTDGGITPRIIGGIDADPTAYPWATALLRSNNSDVFNAQFCGGTLIASEWILTAAHCVVDIASASDVDVAIGFADLEDPGLVRIAVSAIYVHPQYDAFVFDNDLALLKLATPSSNTPVALADNTLTDTVYTNNSLMTIIGWGNTSKTASAYPTLLQETQIPPFNFTSCNPLYGNALTNNMICAAGSALGDKDTCQGDSGGPMLYFNPGDSEWYQTGVTSFGEGCALANTPGVYARVANYPDWINGIQTFDAAFLGSYSFGFQGVGHSTTQTITLTNNSGAAITVSNVSLATNMNFTIAAQTCTIGSIANNSNCTIDLQYTAPGAGTQLDTLTVNLSTGTSFNNTVSGTGLATIDAVALDEMPARIWYSGSDASWFTDSIVNSTGGTAMRSGSIGDSQKSVIVSYVTGPTTLSFRWKASTEAGFDFFNFYVDGVLNDTISGDQDWLQKNISIPSGEHVVSWIYEKNSSANELQDAVWLDDISTASTGGGGGGNSGGGGGAMNGLLLILLMLAAVTQPVSRLVSRTILSARRKRWQQHAAHISSVVQLTTET